MLILCCSTPGRLSPQPCIASIGVTPRACGAESGFGRPNYVESNSALYFYTLTTCLNLLDKFWEYCAYPSWNYRRQKIFKLNRCQQTNRRIKHFRNNRMSTIYMHSCMTGWQRVCYHINFWHLLSGQRISRRPSTTDISIPKRKSVERVLYNILFFSWFFFFPLICSFLG